MWILTVLTCQEIKSLSSSPDQKKKKKEKEKERKKAGWESGECGIFWKEGAAEGGNAALIVATLSRDRRFVVRKGGKSPESHMWLAGASPVTDWVFCQVTH